MTHNLDPLFDIARRAIKTYYPALFEAARSQDKAPIILLSGSFVRGGATKKSDLDIVIIQEEEIVSPKRHSVVFENYPIELFIKTRKAVDDFIQICIERGHATTMDIILNGVPIFPISNQSFYDKIKAKALNTLNQGPPSLSQAEIDSRRYVITDLLDDLDDNRDTLEQFAIIASLYDRVGDFYLRINNQWSGHSKALARLLKVYDAEFSIEFHKRLIKAQNQQSLPLFKFIEKVLEPYGGRFFEGYKKEAN